MANLCTLSDGTTSINFLNSAVYDWSNLASPTPRKKTRWAAAEGLRDGQDLVGWEYDTRQVAVEFNIVGSSHDNLHQTERDLRRLLERGAWYAREQQGPFLTLTYQPNGATTAGVLDVLSGELVALDTENTQAAPGQGAARLTQYRGRYRLVLTCLPYTKIGTSGRTTVTKTIVNRQTPDHRYTYDDSLTTYSLNLNGRVDGHLFANARTGTNSIPVAANDAVRLADTAGRWTDLAFGVAVPLAYTVTPVYTLQLRVAGAWVNATGVTLYDDQNPAGVALGSADITRAFTSTGPKYLTWTDPGGTWVNESLNSVSGYWAQILVSTLGTVSAYPLLQYGPMRNTRNLVRIQASDVLGDAPAACKIQVKPTGSSSIRRATIAHWISQLQAFGVPAQRYEAEFAATAGAGSVDTSTVPALSDGVTPAAALKVGGSILDRCVEFDGSTNGYVEWPDATAGNANLRLNDNWIVDFWLWLDSSRVAPQQLFGKWGASKSYLFYLDGRKLSASFSTDGSTVIKYAKPDQSNDAKKVPLQNPTEIPAQRWTACRIARRGDLVWLMVGASSFGGQNPITTTAKKGRLDGLAGGTINSNNVTVRLGQQVSSASTDTLSQQALTMLDGRIDELRIRVYSGVDDKTFASHVTGDFPSAEATADSAYVGLFHFDDAAGNEVNSAAGQPSACADGVVSGAGVTRSVGKFDVATNETLDATLPLSWQLAQWPGLYRVRAVIRSASTTSPPGHGLRASQGGFYLTPSPAHAENGSVWQTVDLGVLVLPWQGVKPGTSTLGAQQDQIESLGLYVRNDDQAISNAWIDSFILEPLEEGFLSYDSGPTSARAIDQNEFLIYDGLSAMPYVYQANTAGSVQLNPERTMVPAEFQLWPGREQWLSFALTTFSTAETHINTSADITVTIEHRTLGLGF